MLVKTVGKNLDYLYVSAFKIFSIYYMIIVAIIIIQWYSICHKLESTIFLI